MSLQCRGETAAPSSMSRGQIPLTKLGLPSSAPSGDLHPAPVPQGIWLLRTAWHSSPPSCRQKLSLAKQHSFFKDDGNRTATPQSHAEGASFTDW